jgi:hypothetical protein
MISGSLRTDFCFRDPKTDSFLSVAKLFFLDGVLGGVICDDRFVDATRAGNAAEPSSVYRSTPFAKKDTLLSKGNVLGFPLK